MDFTDSLLRSSLFQACLNEQESMVKLLLQYRANPNQSVFTHNMYNALYTMSHKKCATILDCNFRVSVPVSIDRRVKFNHSVS